MLESPYRERSLWDSARYVCELSQLSTELLLLLICATEILLVEVRLGSAPHNSSGSEVLKDVSVTLQFFTTGDSPEVQLVESLEAADVGQRFAMPTGGLS